MWKSTLALASSISKILGFWSRDLARQISCRVPTDKFSPPSLTLALNAPSMSLMDCVNWTSPSARQSCSSVYWSNGSRFDRIVPVNNNGSCGIMPIFDRKSSNPIVDVLIPSITMLPSSGSTSRNKAVMREDLPAPVRPTMPTIIWVWCIIRVGVGLCYLYSPQAWSHTWFLATLAASRVCTWFSNCWFQCLLLSANPQAGGDRK